MERLPFTKIDDSYSRGEFRMAGTGEFQDWARVLVATKDLPATHVTIIRHEDRGMAGMYIVVETVPKASLKTAKAESAPDPAVEEARQKLEAMLKKSEADFVTFAAENGVQFTAKENPAQRVAKVLKSDVAMKALAKMG